MGLAVAGSAGVLLLLIAFSGTVDARALLHKHHHHHHHHGHCKTIAQVLHETPSLRRFAKAFDDAHVPFLSGLVNDPHARATFLAVQDEHLGSGDTVFDEAAIRFQQHTIMDRVKTCKAKDGDVYPTLAGTKLTVVKDSAAHKGRKLQQVTTAMTSLLAMLPGDAEDVPDSARPVSNAAFALPEGQDERGMEKAHEEHGKPHKHGKHGCKQGKHGKHSKNEMGKHHWTPYGAWNDDNDDHEHWKHGKGHGNHHWKHHEFSAKDMVAHALFRAERKAAKHGALFLQSNVTSQRVKVLGGVHACEGTVLIVSAFLNAPPTPEPVVVLAAQAAYTRPEIVHRHHHGAGHHVHHHSWLGCLKHAMKVWEARLDHLLFGGKPHGKRCHGKHRHNKHARVIVVMRREIEQHNPPNDPELLAYYAAHERAQGRHAVKAEAAVAGAVQAALSKVVDAAPQKMQRLVDPRAITFQEVNHTPLVLPSAAAEALRGVQSL